MVFQVHHLAHCYWHLWYIPMLAQACCLCHHVLHSRWSWKQQACLNHYQLNQIRQHHISKSLTIIVLPSNLGFECRMTYHICTVIIFLKTILCP